MSIWTRRAVLSAAFIASSIVIAGPASAQTKLKWAHVYEVAEPYYAEALWAAEEIKKRTNGRYEIGVFAASQLGNENQINEGARPRYGGHHLHRHPFAGPIHKPLGDLRRTVHDARFRLLEAYRGSKLFRDIFQGIRGQDAAQDRHAHLLRGSAWLRPTRKSTSPKT